MLQSKLRQYQALQVMKAELESVQSQLIKFDCDPVTGLSKVKKDEPKFNQVTPIGNVAIQQA